MYLKNWVSDERFVSRGEVVQGDPAYGDDDADGGPDERVLLVQTGLFRDLPLAPLHLVVELLLVVVRQLEAPLVGLERVRVALHGEQHLGLAEVALRRVRVPPYQLLGVLQGEVVLLLLQEALGTLEVEVAGLLRGARGRRLVGQLNGVRQVEERLRELALLKKSRYFSIS